MKTYLKHYPTDNLLCSKDYLEWRINKIEHITKKNVFFTKHHNTITRHSIKYPNNNEKKLKPCHINELASFLDYCYNEGLVHGDIHKKNIVTFDEKVFLIDWEPSLYQIIRNQNSLMVTQPWIDFEDKIKKEITFRTDLLCFFKLFNPVNSLFFKSSKWKNLQIKAFNSKIPFTFLATNILRSISDDPKNSQTF